MNLVIVKKIIKFFLVGIFFFIVVANLTKLKLIAAGDNSWFLNPLFLNRQFVWDQSNLGYFYQIADVIPLVAFYKFFQLFDLPNNIIQTLYFTFFYFGSFISFYFSLKALLPRSNKTVIAIAGLLYVFNPYTLISPFQDRLFPVLIFLPLLFLLYYRLLHERKIKYAFFISLISILYSGANINPPVISIIFIIFTAYLVYFLLSEKLERHEYKILFIQQIILVLFYILTNFWHFVVDIPSMLSVSNIGGKINQFRALDSGHFFDHLRLIGQWAWDKSHFLYKYFPFESKYDEPVLILATYLITFLGLSVILYLPSRRFKSAERKIYYFFLLLFLLGALLANGSKQPLGLFFETLYNSGQVLWMFREPWAKFTPIMVFSLPVIVVGSLSFLAEKFGKSKIKLLLFALVVLLIFINAFPLFNGSVVWNKWNGTMRDSRVEVPAYWTKMAETINKNLSKDERVAVFPYNFIYMAFNWPHGYFASINPARLLLKNPIIVSSSLPSSYSDFLYSKTFEKLTDPNFNLQKYLGVLNSRYVLQENDADWRYSDGKMLSPAESDKLITENGFHKISETGNFSSDYLKQIPNDEPDQVLHKELAKELLDRPVLILYQTDSNEYFLPHFYSPEKILKTDRDFSDLAEIVSDPNYQIKSVVYFEKQNQDLGIKSNNLPEIIDSSPEIEFKKVNPTKYNLVVKKASGKFLLVFNESYEKNWQIYLHKAATSNYFWDNWFKKPVIKQSDHFIASGYANGWVVDTNSLCHSQCRKNADGTFDIELSVEFISQKYYYFGILVSLLTLIILVSYLFYDYRRRKKNDSE